MAGGDTNKHEFEFMDELRHDGNPRAGCLIVIIGALITISLIVWLISSL